MILTLADIELTAFEALLRRYQLILDLQPPDSKLPGTFWGEPEAGLVGNRLYVRPDTPVHSALHEACHYICMDAERRQALHTDAGGTAMEENGTCYLQILLSDEVPEMGRERMFADIDEWGYSFRLGSAKAWFEDDAEDAQTWLLDHHLIDSGNRPAFVLRQ